MNNFTSSVGGRGGGANGGNIFVRMVPREERKRHVDQVIQDLRPKLAAVPGIKAYMQNPPLIRVGGMSSKNLYQYTIQGPNLEELYTWAPILERRMAQIPGIQDVTTDLLISTPQLKVDMDRDKARALGVTVSQIENRALQRLRPAPGLHHQHPGQ